MKNADAWFWPSDGHFSDFDRKYRCQFTNPMSCRVRGGDLHLSVCKIGPIHLRKAERLVECVSPGTLELELNHSSLG